MYRSILVPLDGSAFAASALPAAGAIARASGATLELLKVHELYALKDPACAWLPYSAAEDDAARAAERADLEGLARRLNGEGVAARVLVVDGPKPDSILGRARELVAGLIVMAAHGRGALARLFA